MSMVQPVVEVVPTLDEYRERIYERLSAAAIDIGNLLIAAKRDHRLRFVSWVEAEMPWSLDVAERLMAVARTFANATPETMAALPKPYSTLYELTKLDPDRLQRAITVGEVTPELTHREAAALASWERKRREAAEVTPDASSEATSGGNVAPEPSEATSDVPRPVTDADLHAIGLMRQEPADLRPELTDELRKWLQNAESGPE